MDLAEHSCSTNWGDYKSIKQNHNESKKILVWHEGKTGVPEENLLEQKENQQTQPMYGV